MQKKSIHTEKGPIVYWISDTWDSNRQTLFFLHGFSADHTLFTPQFSYFQDAYNLIAWDAPAHGKSKPFEKFSIEDALKSMLGILIQEDVETFVAIGQSIGGYFAQAFMCRLPHMVSGFVGIGSMPYGEDYYTDSEYAWMRKTTGMAKFTPWSVLKVASATSATATDAGYENMLHMVSQMTKKEYAQLADDYCNMFIEDNQNLDITCPTLLMHGDNDTIGKVKEHCLEWHERTKFPLIVIENAGHNANVDNPKAVNEAIQNFLKELAD